MSDKVIKIIIAVFTVVMFITGLVFFVIGEFMADFSFEFAGFIPMAVGVISAFSTTLIKPTNGK